MMALPVRCKNGHQLAARALGAVWWRASPNRPDADVLDSADALLAAPG